MQSSVISPDTDIFIFLLYFFKKLSMEIVFVTGFGHSARKISVFPKYHIFVAYLAYRCKKVILTLYECYCPCQYNLICTRNTIITLWMFKIAFWSWSIIKYNLYNKIMSIWDGSFNVPLSFIISNFQTEQIGLWWVLNNTMFHLWGSLVCNEGIFNPLSQMRVHCR